MTTPIFTTTQEGNICRTLIVDTSGRGKSRLLEVEAQRLGVACEELLRRMEPTEEQQERQRMRQQEENRAEGQRLNTVREAFADIIGVALSRGFNDTEVRGIRGTEQASCS